MSQDNWLTNNWLNLVLFIVILFASWRVSILLPKLSELKQWILILFTVGVWCSAGYEISIKQSIKKMETAGKIFLKVIAFWVLPLFIGSGLGLYLN
jgi:Na+/H+-dicarboxylate symporter